MGLALAYFADKNQSLVPSFLGHMASNLLPGEKRLDDREEVREIPEDDCVFIIGLTEKMPFPQYEFILSPGQLLFLYTDGVTNAEGEGKEAYGRERLADSLQGAKDARDAVGRAEDALRRFTGEREQTDDITMLCVAMR